MPQTSTLLIAPQITHINDKRTLYSVSPLLPSEFTNTNQLLSSKNLFILPLYLKSQMYALTSRVHLRAITCRAVSTTTTVVQPEQIKATQADPISLKSTWQHRAWVMAGSIAILTPIYESISVSSSSIDFVDSFLAGLVGYFLADLGSGFYHWAIDNYGGPSTPLFGPQIEAFQGHHKYPYTITRREVCNNLHALSRSVLFVVPPIDFLFAHNSSTHAFVGVCASCIMLSQQFHSWSHEKKRKLPPIVLALQEAGVLVSRSEHGAHHRMPYNSKYCIVSGAWNGILDELKVFEILEMVIFFKFGVRPRSWSETQKEWREVESSRIGDDYYAFEKIVE